MNLLKISTLSMALLLGAITWNGCKDAVDPNAGGPDCTLSNPDLSYTKNIKAIIDTYCLSCHAGAGPGPHDYTTYETLKPHIDEGHILDRVVIKKNMPEGGGMPQSVRDSINCWIKAGYPK